jgi:hypothetical protein
MTRTTDEMMIQVDHYRTSGDPQFLEVLQQVASNIFSSQITYSHQHKPPAKNFQRHLARGRISG